MSRSHISVTVRQKVNVDDARLNLAVMNPATDYARRVQSAIFFEAVHTAPRRSGELAASHVNTGVQRRGPWQADGTIRNVSGHARYVHEGTDGPIFPTHSTFLMIHGTSAGKAGPITGRARWVRGQRAQPWLVEAAQRVSARMGGSIRSVGH